MIVLAVDPGRSTGWACSCGGGGAARFLTAAEERKLDATARHALLGHRFRLWLDVELYRHGVGVLVVERQQGGRGGGEVTLGLRMLALTTACDKQVATREVWPNEWRRWAKAELGWTEADKDDEQDARTMLAWWLANGA